jgi:hypothetical protein
MSSIACVCADPLASVTNDACSAVKYGSQIVKLFIQKMDGETWDGTTGNDIAVEADWDTKIAAVTDDKIITIGSIIGTRDSAEPTIEEGNDVPYGGAEIIDRPQAMNFIIKYFSETTFAEIDQSVCWGKVRVWMLDNENYLWGSTLEVDNGDGILDANIISTTLSQAGIGTRNKSENNQVRWNELCQPVPVGQYSFLKTK